MEEQHFVIDDAAIHFNASKNKDYQERVRARFETFVTFLQANGLTTRVILADGQEVNRELRILGDDLTEEGLAVVKASYDAWLRGIDRGKLVTDVSIMERTLRKVRSQHI